MASVFTVQSNLGTSYFSLPKNCKKYQMDYTAVLYMLLPEILP